LDHAARLYYYGRPSAFIIVAPQTQKTGVRPAILRFSIINVPDFFGMTRN
jgi:hypothetical protein